MVATRVALFDASVLYAMPVTDLVMQLALDGLFEARWSARIHDEWMRSVARERPDLPPHVIERRRVNMDRALPRALVTDDPDPIANLSLPDDGDRHVLAAAIAGRADVLVTFNLRHFPAEAIAAYGLEVQHPDVFLDQQRRRDGQQFLESVKTVRERLSKPKYDPDGYIANLRRCNLPIIAAELETVKALI
jgi:predicted nucleic acid-binding protein